MLKVRVVLLTFTDRIRFYIEEKVKVRIWTNVGLPLPTTTIRDIQEDYLMTDNGIVLIDAIGMIQEHKPETVECEE